MKTTNKIQKTVLTAAFAVSFLIVGFSIDAQVETNSFFKINQASNLAMATVKSGNYSISSTFNPTGSTTENKFAAYLVIETEAPLKVEEWMMNDANFSSVTFFKLENEIPMEVEDWMMKEKTFDANLLAIETETDEPLEMEDWMMDDRKFMSAENNVLVHKTKLNNKVISTQSYVYQEVNIESKLTIEGWMMNPKIWK